VQARTPTQAKGPVPAEEGKKLMGNTVEVIIEVAAKGVKIEANTGDKWFDKLINWFTKKQAKDAINTGTEKALEKVEDEK
jgi:hypothetical protein